MRISELHIVAFDVPFPPDYGGAMDVYYRIKALHELGIKVHLHCFEYGRGMPTELKACTATIQYYKRKKSVADSFSKLPFIVKTRNSRHLIQNLLKDDFPILFEGLHCCYFLADERLKSRVKLVRLHNIEHEYYAGLAKLNSGWRSRFYRSEAEKLKNYESTLKHANHLLAIKESDAIHFKQYADSVQVLPASCPPLNLAERSETQPVCLFHGNLSVAENRDAVYWLQRNIFSKLQDIPFVVAGKNPNKELQQFCAKNEIQLHINPDENKLDTLIQQARVHVFYSEQNSGVKLKLLRALSSNGHAIVNHKMIEGSTLGTHCNLALIPEDFKDLVQEKVQVELSEVEFDARQLFLQENYDTKRNCELILKIIS